MEINTVDTLRFVVYALAVFRASYFLWWENGPWDVVDWIRARAGIRWEEVPIVVTCDSDNTFEYSTKLEQVVVVSNNVLAKLLSCPVCISLWLALPAAVLWYLRWWPADVGAAWFAVGAVSLMLYGYKRPGS